MNIQDEGIIVELDIYIPQFPYVPGLEDLAHSLRLDFRIFTVPYGSSNKFIGVLPIVLLDTWKTYICNTHNHWNNLIYKYVTSEEILNRFNFNVSYKVIPRNKMLFSNEEFETFRKELDALIEGDFKYARNFKQTRKS